MKWLIVVAAIMLTPAIAHAGYGVLTYSKPDNTVGWAFGYPTVEDANRRAIYECEKSGGKDCNTIQWEHNMCVVALAVPTGGNGWTVKTFAPVHPEMRQPTLDKCEREFDRTCEYRAGICN
jgi:Domain of unknown function (DUF4189)